MESKQTTETIVALLRKSEAIIADRNEEMHILSIEMSECEAENDQLFADCRSLDNTLNQIVNRVAIVKGGLSNPEIAIEEIAAILESIDK